MSKFKECEVCGAALDPGEKCDCGMDKYLPAIRCTQPPIIVENLDSVRQNLEILLADISTLPQDDEALKYVKQIRANLAKDFERMEIQRKAAKKQVMEPYDTANEKYQAYVAAPYKEADDRLKKWVDDYQNGMKQMCEKSLRAYFNELCQANGIDFLPFGYCGVVVDMTMARKKEHPKKVLEQISNCVMAVRSDMDAILKMEDAEEIMVAYRKNPSLSEVMVAWNQQKQDKERMRLFLEDQRRQQAQQSVARAAMIEAAPEILPEQENRYTVAFLATGSIASLKAMKAYGLTLGITFEDIKQEDENNE